MSSSSSSFTFVFSLTILLVSTQCFSATLAPSPSSVPHEKVSVALYYESLCPECKKFIVNYFPLIFTSGITEIMDLKIVPFGNARVEENSTISCQHGPIECFLNKVEACAIHVWPDVEKHSLVIHCLERLVFEVEGNYMLWSSCLKKPGFSTKPILDCIDSGLGLELELQYGNETNSLMPPHKYVPWVTVNNKPLYDEYDNFVKAVCNAYKGTSLPKVCEEAAWQDQSNPTHGLTTFKDTYSAAHINGGGVWFVPMMALFGLFL